MPSRRRYKRYAQANPWVDAGSVDVSVKDGVATLKGSAGSMIERTEAITTAWVSLEGKVDSAFEKNYAEFVASRVPGVVDVQNSLKVVGLEVPRKTDSAVQQQIEYGLHWSPYVESNGIAVSVKDGIATLSGTAGSWREKIAATEIAQRAGAESVLNQVKVKDLAS